MSDAPLLGLSMDATADFRGLPGAKNAGLFGALDARCGVSEVLQPALPALEQRLLQLRRVHWDRGRWRRRFNLWPDTFMRRSAVAHELLEAREGRFSLVVQLHTLVAPGLQPGRWPYVLHTDTTYALTARHYPEGAPLRGGDRRRWLELERQVYRGAAVLFPRSEWLARSLVEDYGCRPERVVVVGGGANQPRDSLEGREWGSRRALFVGRVGHRKGLDVLLRAWPDVVRAVPEARLTVVGLPEAPRALPPGVDWAGVISSRSALAAHYDAADVFVLPSRYEPWGHVFFEAMGRGLACVGTATCAMPEIIAPGETGLLVPPGQPAPLADALSRLLGDPVEAEAMGRAAFARVSAGCTWEDVVARMAPRLEEAMGEPLRLDAAALRPDLDPLG